MTEYYVYITCMIVCVLLPIIQTAVLFIATDEIHDTSVFSVHR